MHRKKRYIKEKLLYKRIQIVKAEGRNNGIGKLIFCYPHYNNDSSKNHQ